MTRMSRRRAILGTLAAAAPLGEAFAQTPARGLPPGLSRRGTPQLTLGPFYPVIRPLEEDADLTTVQGRRALGQIIDIAGRVTREDGTPVPNAILDIWQVNAAGRYFHPNDPSGAPLDPGFQGAAIIRADAEGRYRFRTVKPAPYADRAPHIHFDVKGRHRRLMTQMFFPGEALNADDNLYKGLGTAALRSKVTAIAQPKSGDAPPLYLWDIALAAE